MANLLLSVELVNDRGSFNRSIYIDDVYDIVEKVLKINPATELAVCQRGRDQAKYYIIGVKNEDIWNRLNLSAYIGERAIL